MRDFYGGAYVASVVNDAAGEYPAVPLLKSTTESTWGRVPGCVQVSRFCSPPPLKFWDPGFGHFFGVGVEFWVSSGSGFSGLRQN